MILFSVELILQSYGLHKSNGGSVGIDTVTFSRAFDSMLVFPF